MMKKALKILGFIFLGLFILVGIGAMIGEDEETPPIPKTEVAKEVEAKIKAEADQEAKEQAEQKAKEEAKIKAEADAKAKAEAEKKAQEDAISHQSKMEEQVFNILKENMPHSEIEFNKEDKTYTVHTRNKELAQEIAMIFSGVAPIDSWNEMKESMAGASESFMGIVGEGYSVAMSNPSNEKNLILLITEGVVIYDVMDERGM